MNNRIIDAINDEWKRQEDKRGKWKHGPLRWLAILTEEVGEVAKAMLDNDARNMECEIAQVAAVAVAWLEQLFEEEEE